MAQVRGRDTKPELFVRSAIHRMGYRFRLHYKNLPGRPDIAFPGRKKLIFVHGCFWHRHENCSLATTPKTREDFWWTKFRVNKARDARNNFALKKLGWKVLIIWECELRDAETLAVRIRRFLK